MENLISISSPPKGGPGPAATNNDLRRTSVFLGGVGFCGVLALGLWSCSLKTGGLTAFAFGLLLMAGTGLVGGIIGLLFGIPKSVSDPSSGLPPADTGNSTAAGVGTGENRRPGYATNTNLEQISDWLTKILVGVGLTEIATIREQFRNLATYFGDGFLAEAATTPSGTASVVAGVIVIFGLTGGFIAGYLFTRIFLTGAFVRVDESLLRRQNTELTQQIKEVKASTEEAGRVQGEIYRDLYRYEEQGFRDAIQKLDALLAAPANQGNPALWVYLAAAHGQAYAWETEHPRNGQQADALQLKLHRDEALNAVKRALASGAEAWKPVLQQMWDKESSAKVERSFAKEEDDLEVFYNDPEFRQLLAGG
jgi:hypothetical protein